MILQKNGGQVGETISHYKILEKIGEGGMGVVYKAEDTKLKRIVALKFLASELTRDATAKQRFIQEAQAASKLDHPNICTIYEINETEDGQLYIAMAYYKGETLKEKTDEGPLRIDETLTIAINIAEGLQEAHEHGITHRDIKPSNIMITDKGQTKILDFGLAKSDAGSIVTKAGTTLGTIAIMSPEQARGEKVDKRTDIWSLGVVIYNMLTGQMPFKGEYEHAIVYSIMNVDPEPITGVRTGVPIELEKIINKCLEKDKSERYPTAEGLLVDLRKLKKDTGKFVSTPPVEVKRTEITPPAEQAEEKGTTTIIKITPKRRKILIACAAALLIAAGYFIIDSFKGKVEPEAVITPVSKIKNSIAIMYFENNTGDESLDHWREGLSNLLITDLSQSQYIKVLPGDRLYNILDRLNQLNAKRYSSEVLNQVADMGGVENILLGSFIRAGDIYRINVTLQEAGTDNIIGSESVQGTGEASMITMVDELTRKIKENLELTAEEIAVDIDYDIGIITTSSPVALQYYIEGRKLHDLGGDNFLRSIELMEKAVAIDSGFAMAYRSMAMAYGNLGKKAEIDYLQKAFELTDRVSARELYTIQADVYRGKGIWDKAIEAFNNLLKLYPDDWIGNNNFGLLYTNLEEWDKAIERLEVNRRNKVIPVYTSEILYTCYNAKGMYDKAREVLEDTPPGLRSDADKYRRLARTYIFEGKLDLALVEANKALELEPDNYVFYYYIGDIYLYKGEFDKAEENYQKIMELEVPNTYYVRMGALYRLQGKFEQYINQHKQRIELAKEQENKTREWNANNYLNNLYLRTGHPEKVNTEALDEAWDYYAETNNISWKSAILYFKGWTFVEQELLDEAEKKAEEISNIIYQGSTKIKYAERYYNHLMGMIELKRNDFSKAVDYFEKALSTLPAQRDLNEAHGFFMGPLASAYYSAGESDKAQEMYEKIQSLTSGRLSWGDIYAESFYNLGKIYQEKDWKGKAIEQYTAFIELWKDCDPELRWMVDDAQQQITILK